MHIANVSFLLKQLTTDPGFDCPDGADITEGIMTFKPLSHGGHFESQGNKNLAKLRQKIFNLAANLLIKSNILVANIQIFQIKTKFALRAYL